VGVGGVVGWGGGGLGEWGDPWFFFWGLPGYHASKAADGGPAVFAGRVSAHKPRLPARPRARALTQTPPPNHTNRPPPPTVTTTPAPNPVPSGPPPPPAFCFPCNAPERFLPDENLDTSCPLARVFPPQETPPSIATKNLRGGWGGGGCRVGAVRPFGRSGWGARGG